jgi:hypothetical protein
MSAEYVFSGVENFHQIMVMRVKIAGSSIGKH